MNAFGHRPHVRLAPALALGLAALVSACGDDDSLGGTGLGSGDPDTGGSDDVGGVYDTGDGSSSDDTDGSGGTESDVIVTVDGQEYAVTTVQSCTTEGDDRNDLQMFGFAETGERVELSFDQQSADESPTGAVAYYGRVGISSGEITAQVETAEPFAFLDGDRSSVSDSVTMETTGPDAGRTIEVDFDITCP